MILKPIQNRIADEIRVVNKVRSFSRTIFNGKFVKCTYLKNLMHNLIQKLSQIQTQTKANAYDEINIKVELYTHESGSLGLPFHTFFIVAFVFVECWLLMYFSTSFL